jgi:membrane-associated phospholipid phosphatase
VEEIRPWKPIAFSAGALAVAALTAAGPGKKLDQRVYQLVNTNRGAGTDALFKGITELGSITASAAAAAVLARRGRHREAMQALAAATAMWGLGQLAKKTLRRPRPYQALGNVRLLIHEPKGTSWPSSHPAVLLAFVTVAGRALSLRRGERVGLTALAGAVGVSRVYVGVHYPADVLGGLLLGKGVADLCSLLPPSRPITPATVRS